MVSNAAARETWRRSSPRPASLHADAETILKLIQSGEPALLECDVPQLAEDLLGDRVPAAELIDCLCHGGVSGLLIHP
jgi:hypothetical protein